MSSVSNWGTPIVIGKATREGSQAAAGGVLAVGGLGTVKGATEYQHRVKVGTRAAEQGVRDAVNTADRSYTLAREAKGKTGSVIIRPDGAKTKRRISPGTGRNVGLDRIRADAKADRFYQSDAAQNARLGVSRAKIKYGVAQRLEKPRLKAAQRTKLGGLAALAAGTYLGVKGLRGMEAQRG